MDTFCIYPWIHMFVNTDGSVMPCCIAKSDNPLGNVQKNSIEDIWNSESYKTIRLKMLNGERSNECANCYITEDRGIKSVRQKKLDDYKHLLDIKDKTNSDGSLDNLELHHFDVRWSNICNFKCRTCTHSLSSSIATEQQKLDSTIPIYTMAGGKSNKDLVDQFIPYFKDIETFYFAGGEPLITEQHYTILEELILQGRTQDVALQYNTNLSMLIYKDKSLFDLWKKFSNVSIGASLDSWGKRAEYIRDGTDWNAIEENIKIIRTETPHVRINVQTVVSVFNIGTLSDFLDYMLSTSFNEQNFFLEFFNVIEPNYFSLSALDTHTAQQFSSKLKNSLTKYRPHIQKQLSNVIKWLDSSEYNPNLHQQCIKEIALRDSLRNKQLADYIPELGNIFDTAQQR